MRPQAFQAGEVRDEHDNIIRQGAYGKKTPFATADNSGILDYIINNFDVLYKGIKAAGIGNPVVSITQNNGNLTVTKGDGSNTSIALPAPDVSNLAKLHENNIFTGTNVFYNCLGIKDVNKGEIPIFEAKQDGIGLYRRTTAEGLVTLKEVSSKYTSTTTARRVYTDVVELKTPDNTAAFFDPQTVWNFSSANETKVCVLLITGAGAPTIEWVNCKLCCEAPAKTADKATIVTFFITDTAFYLVSAMQEV